MVVDDEKVFMIDLSSAWKVHRMNVFLSFLRVLFFLPLLCAMHTYACETNEGDASYSALPVDGGFLVFSPVGVLEDEGKPNPEIGIRLSFIDGSTGTKKLIARLPYVAGPGEVQNAFWADVESGSRRL